MYNHTPPSTIFSVCLTSLWLQLCPHILHYGRADSTTKSMKFSLSRPCKGGEQCYLSYGCFSSSHLLNFYGFLPKGDNPYDVIPLGMYVILLWTYNEFQWSFKCNDFFKMILKVVGFTYMQYLRHKDNCSDCSKYQTTKTMQYYNINIMLCQMKS